MQCRYCRAWINDEDHRCTRCGRRTISAGARPAPGTYPIQTATAPDLIAYAAPAVEASEPVPQQTPRVTYQRSLFRDSQQVIAMPSLGASESRDTLKPPRTGRSRTGRRTHADQQALDFAAPRLRTAMEAVIYCDAPVAQPMHRVLAVAIDTTMIVIALALFVTTFYLAGGTVVLNSRTVPLFAGAAVVFGLFYHILFCIGNGDTPGTEWAQLQLLNFDGQRPDRHQRASRLLSTCLSTMAAGLGVLWALVDEEKLTWHDHMSRTFLTPKQ